MVKRIPTHAGDVLILSRDQSFAVFAVGLVTIDGQQEFDVHMNVQCDGARAAAVADAEALVVPGRRIFCRNIETEIWVEISG